MVKAGSRGCHSSSDAKLAGLTIPCNTVVVFVAVVACAGEVVTVEVSILVVVVVVTQPWLFDRHCNSFSSRNKYTVQRILSFSVCYNNDTNNNSSSSSDSGVKVNEKVGTK